MKRLRKQHLLEQSIYGVIWSVIFLLPLIGGYFAVSSGLEKEEMRIIVRDSWLSILPFFLLFLLNNYGLVPYFLFQRKYWQYVFSIILLVVAICCFVEGKPSYQKGGIPWEEFPHRELARKKLHRPERFSKQFPRPVPPFSIRYFVHFVITVSMVGFNIAIKLFLKSFRDEERLKELEHERLQSELQYLKYQINPHFFMNTLNNIHALVDIDTAKAKSTLVELSKLMRYVLYEASNKTILLSREIQFLENYVTLMSLRYPDKVSIEKDFPLEVPEAHIPPLLFVSFVENAFKHGISYRKESFIQVVMQLEDGNKLAFRCVNSTCGSATRQPHHGIGLENIRKRLRLLFGNDYTLSIHEEENIFNVLLIIPLLE